MAELNREFLVSQFGSEDELIKQTEIKVNDNNTIKRINSNAFKGLVNLEKLSLSNNEIEEIESNTFESLENLKVLQLDSNKIERIDSNTFKGLSKLEHLELNYNRISKIEPNAFECLGNLSTLWLGRNKLNVIESNVFKGLLRLENLNLLFIDIEVIEKNAFEGLSSLKALLIWGKIKHVKSHAFKGLTGISTICLNNLDISEIDAHAFNGLSNLTQVDLSKNKLKKINPYTFEGLESLLRLSLNMNEIEEIEENVFHGLSNLIELFLNGNKLKRINRKSFEPLNSIEVLKLYDNDIDFLSYVNRDDTLDKDLNNREFYTDWNEFLEDIDKKNYIFKTPKMVIEDYYDSLIYDIDIYTDEILKKYTENDVLPEVDQNYRFANEINLKEVENHKFFEIDSIIDPYKEEYKLNKEQTNLIPGSTKLHDYINDIRLKSIEEINKVRGENYDTNRDIRNDLPRPKVEEMRRELFKKKFCFLLRIDNIFEVIIPIKYILIITDFYFDSFHLYKFTKTLKNSFPYNLKLTENAILAYLLAKYVSNRLHYKIYGNEVIFITRDDLFKIERINGVETNLFFVENNKRGDFELNSSNDYSNIKSLGLTKGDYSKLDDLRNSMANLEYLYISNMNIGDETFNGFNKLIKLSLEHCLMNTDLKWSLKNLQILEIGELLEGLDSIDLESLESLKILILESVESFDCLKNLGRKLTGLSISNNTIYDTQIPEISSFLKRHDFSNVTHLRLHMGLNSDDFSIWFKSFKSLKKLSLIGSCRNSLNLEFLQSESLNQLEYLNLSDNSILTIRKEDFSQLKSLKHLDISKNRISYIDPEVFAEMAPLLAHLNIRGNKCKIEEKTFYSLLKHLKTIEF